MAKSWKSIVVPGVKKYHNSEWADANMLVSLLCASEEFTDDVIVSHSDILYEDRLLQGMMQTTDDYCVAVDSQWRDYWQLRYGRVDYDLETLKTDGGCITALGRGTDDPNDCEARYIGLLKFSKEGIEEAGNRIQRAVTDFAEVPWQASGKVGRKAYMTDLIQDLIDSGLPVRAVTFEHGWLEFDTNEDYEIVVDAASKGSLVRLFMDND